MKTQHTVLLTLGLLVSSEGWTAASDPPSSILVSTFNGQVLEVKVDGGIVTVLPLFTENGSALEDIVVAPDGKIYICDARSNGRIFRVKQDGSEKELVYASSGGDPKRPAGPSFSAQGDLYFSTRGTIGGPNVHSGVWRIPGIATIPLRDEDDPPFPAPEQVVDEMETGSTFGEGTTFDVNGDLLIVDRSGGRVLKKDLMANTPITVLITGLDTPIGVEVDPDGKIYVADAGTTNSIKRFNSNGTPDETLEPPGTFVTFTPSESPHFMEFDLAGTLFVTTSEFFSGEFSKVWKVQPSGATTPVISLFDFDFNRAVGLALPATRASASVVFTGRQTRKVDLGYTSAQITVDARCELTITAEERLPEEVNAELQMHFPDAECRPPSPQGGFCIVWKAEGCSPENVRSAVDSYFGYYSRENFGTEAASPRLLKKDGSGFMDITAGYVALAGTAIGPGRGGSSDGFGEFLAADLPRTEEGNFCGFLPPLRPSRPNEIKSGRTLPVKFRLSRSPNCSGDFISNAQALMSIVKTTPTFEWIVPKASGNSNIGTLFRYDFEDNQYIYNLSLKGYTKGTYLITVMFDNFSGPRSIEFMIQ